MPGSWHVFKGVPGPLELFSAPHSRRHMQGETEQEGPDVEGAGEPSQRSGGGLVSTEVAELEGGTHRSGDLQEVSRSLCWIGTSLRFYGMVWSVSQGWDQSGGGGVSFGEHCGCFKNIPGRCGVVLPSGEHQGVPRFPLQGRGEFASPQ